MPAEEKARYKLVRRDALTDIEGEIVSADAKTGDHCLLVPKRDEHGNPVIGDDGKLVREARAFVSLPDSFYIVKRR